MKRAASLVADTLTGRESDEILKIRELRQQAEARLERRQLNWALDRFTRHDKNATGERGRTYAQALELEAKERAALNEGKGTPQVSIPGASEPAAIVPAGEKRRPEEIDELVLRTLESDLPLPEGLKSQAVGEPGKAMTPLERGSFRPLAAEYLEEVIPSYLTTEEEKKRWRELRAAEKTYEKKVKRRMRNPGVARCQGVPIDARGHDWMKVPGQGVYECLECGLETSIGLWNLRGGKMYEVAAYKTSRAQKMFGRIAGGDAKFLLPPGMEAMLEAGPMEAIEPANSARAKLVAAQVKRPEVPEGMRDDPLAALEVKSLHERSEYDPGADGVCLNCGAVKEAHKELTLPSKSVGGVIFPEDGSLRCPQHGVDAT